MKKVGVTQRVDFIESYGERRDALDQRWTSLLLSYGIIPIPLPNMLNDVKYFEMLNLDGILLSGGNDILGVNPDSSSAARERDILEHSIVDWGISKKIPVLGVCRGMQFLNIFFGGSVSYTGNSHVNIKHKIRHFDLSENKQKFEVNSYHNYSILMEDLAAPFSPLMVSNDGVVESFVHKTKNIHGIMWHPERNTKLSIIDDDAFNNFLKNM